MPTDGISTEDLLESIKPPSKDKMIEIDKKRYEEDGWTFLDRWPETLARLSFPTKFILLEPPILNSLINPFGLEFEENKDVFRPLEQKIEEVLRQAQSPVFFKLNSRSPKDIGECISMNPRHISHALKTLNGR